MTDCQKNKAVFVYDHLTPMIKDINSAITKVEYCVEDNGEELIRIEYSGCYRKVINVTGDSKSALARDVLRCV